MQLRKFLATRIKSVIIYLCAFWASAIFYCPIQYAQSKEIDAKKLFDFGELRPRFDITPALILSRNPICVDKTKNIYFLDFKNHRVLQFDLRGNFIRQIGQIGQDENCLFEPLGIYCHNNEIFVLDKGGNQIKAFSQEDKFVSGGRFKADEWANSFVVSGKSIIANVLARPNYRTRLPLSVYTMDFVKSEEIGTQVKSSSFAAYPTFNEAYLCSAGNSIFAAFRAYPVLFCVDTNGVIIFNVDLMNMHIEEVEKIAKEGKERRVDTPHSIRNINQVHSMIYCNGLAVDSSGDIFYGLNYDAAKKGIILHFNSSGELKEKMILKLDSAQARIEALCISDNLRLVLASKGKERIGANISLLEF